MVGSVRPIERHFISKVVVNEAWQVDRRKTRDTTENGGNSGAGQNRRQDQKSSTRRTYRAGTLNFGQKSSHDCLFAGWKLCGEVVARGSSRPRSNDVSSAAGRNRQPQLRSACDTMSMSIDAKYHLLESRHDLWSNRAASLVVKSAGWSRRGEFAQPSQGLARREMGAQAGLMRPELAVERAGELGSWGAEGWCGGVAWNVGWG